MQLLSLRIKNLNSLKGEHCINFNNGPLAETGLFAITGPTGAGKSTILDAITLALYNQTPRSGAVSSNSIAQLGSVITRNTDEAWAQLDFQVKEKVYRSQWGISRNRNGKLRDYTLVLSEQVGAKDFKALDLKKGEVPKENARIIGLNFDQFLRSILLSQGDFARFLKSNSNERGELLEKITGTEIYRTIGQRAFNRQKQEWGKLEDLKKQLEGIELLSEEDYTALKQELVTLETGNKELDFLVKQLNEQLKVIREAKANELIIIDKKEQLLRLEEDKQQFKPQQSRLKVHQLLLPLKADVIGVKNSEKNLDDKLNEQGAKVKQKSDLSIKQKQINVHLIDAQKNYQRLLDKELELTPLVKQVRELDSQIKITTSQYSKLLKDYNEENDIIEKSHEELNVYGKNIDKQEIEIEKINLFLKNRSMLNQLSEHLPALKVKNVNLRSAFCSFEDKLNVMSESQTKQSLLTAPSLLDKQMALTEALKKSESYLKSQMPLLKIGDKLFAQKQKEDLQEKVRSLEKVFELLKQLLDIDGDNKTLIKALDEKANLCAENKSALLKVKQSIELNNKYLQEYKVRRERELLEAKYEDARQLLKPDQECPLCGSTEHPYVKDYQRNSNETELLLIKHTGLQEELDKEKNKLIELTSKLETELKNLNRQISQLSEDKVIKNELVEVLYGELELDKTQTNLGVVNNQMTEIKKQIAFSDSQIRLLDNIETATLRNKEFKSINVELINVCSVQNALKQELDVYKDFLHTDEIDKQLVDLEQSYNIFKTKQEQLQKLEGELLKTNTIWDEKAKHLKQKIVAIAKVKEQLEIMQLQLNKEKEKRSALFGEDYPDEVIAKLLAEKGNVADEQKNIELTLSDINSSLTATDDRLIILSDQILKETIALEEDKKALIARLDAQSISSFNEALQSLLSDEEYKLLIDKQEKIKTREVELRQSLKDESLKQEQLKVDLDSIKLSEFELTKLISEKEELLKAHFGKVGSLNEKIAQDNRNKVKQADKVKVIQTQENEFNRWSSLSSLIGDAQGNKFAKFAQELTLQQVLKLANGHLKSLSDRYLIKHVKADNLDELFVVDTYHGNAERSVKTLSGGESFLVSLSLALGLSDLAGQNTVIGSLFIDEGFGTLDQNTLDLALSALEKLQNETNRTIGIISHVPALKERVTTQIELSKNASGYSTLEVKS